MLSCDKQDDGCDKQDDSWGHLAFSCKKHDDELDNQVLKWGRHYLMFNQHYHSCDNRCHIDNIIIVKIAWLCSVLTLIVFIYRLRHYEYYAENILNSEREILPSLRDVFILDSAWPLEQLA